MTVSTSKRPIYLDYAATTPVDPVVAERMAQCLTAEGDFGNPASRQHAYGRAAAEVLEQARTEVATLLNADPSEIVWTSGATESNNLAIKGVAEAHAERGRHLITLKTEHKSVVDCYRQLEQRGWRVTWLVPDAEGCIDAETVAAAITDETVLLSIMAVNNETGVCQDIASIARVTAERGVLLHVDAAQALGKLPLDVAALQVDLLSVSAHKCYGPKGIGALYVRRRPRARLNAQMHGGGHERGLRSGTLATHQIAGFGQACALAAASMAADSEQMAALRDQLWAGLNTLPGVYRNGSDTQCAPNILNLSFAGVDGEALHAGLAPYLAVSSGSACTVASQESSYVLRALGRDDELAYASIRFSLGRWTSEADINAAISIVRQHVQRLRALSAHEGESNDAADAGDGVLTQASSHPDYSEAVWRYFESQARVGRWPESADVISVSANTPGSRAVLAVQLKLAQGRVVDSRYRVYGCVSAIACGAWLAEWLLGKTQQEAGALTASDIDSALSLAPVKRHCALLAEDALGMLVAAWGQSEAVININQEQEATG